jgi:hypothetical protein
MLDYFDAYSSDELVVTFQDCLFHNNRYLGSDAYSALIFGNSEQNRLVLERTVFESNNMIFNNTQVGCS